MTAAAGLPRNGAPPTANDLRQAMGRFATGVTILLTDGSDSVHGMTANAVCSISLEPPLVLVSLDNRTKMRDLVTEGVRFSVNVLSVGQVGLADQFANRWSWSPSDPTFRTLGGSTALEGSLVSVVCEAETVSPAGDHTIVLGRVIDLDVRDGTPLIFYRGKWTSFPGPEDVFLIDRANFREKLRTRLPADPSKLALLALDFTGGHFDPEAATMPLPPEVSAAVVQRSQAVLHAVRAWGRPVVHVTLSFGPDDVARNPFFRAVDELNASVIPWSERRLRDHNPKGSPQAEIIPAMAPLEGEPIIDGRSRYSAFFGTKLDDVLEDLGIETLVIIGMNTNTTILHTSLDAFCRDYEVIVLSDCTTSVYGPDLHELALRDIEFCVGWAVESHEFVAHVDAHREEG
jgi:nicotinamidase-related amidase/flavin reductase (DIM6/NTAB) family NADH-FMN oxidoreductase RutF